MAKRVISIRLDQDVIDELGLLASSLQGDRSSVIQAIVERFIDMNGADQRRALRESSLFRKGRVKTVDRYIPPLAVIETDLEPAHILSHDRNADSAQSATKGPPRGTDLSRCGAAASNGPIALHPRTDKEGD